MRVLLMLAVLFAAVALGANPKARELAKDADKLYKDNQYKDAAEKLKEAYALEPNAVYLYNIARALDQAGEVQQALDAYRRYVGLPSDDSSPDLVKKANLAMDRLRTLQAKSEADKQLSDAEKKRLTDEASREKARAEREAESARSTKASYEAKERASREASTKGLDSRKLISFVVGGVGLASLATSLICAIVAVVDKQAFTVATTVADKRRLQADTTGFAITTDITLLVGLAAATTAVILFPKGEEPVSFGITPLAGGVYASLGGTF